MTGTCITATKSTKKHRARLTRALPSPGAAGGASPQPLSGPRCLFLVNSHQDTQHTLLFCFCESRWHTSAHTAFPPGLKRSIVHETWEPWVPRTVPCASWGLELPRGSAQGGEGRSHAFLAGPGRFPGMKRCNEAKFHVSKQGKSEYSNFTFIYLFLLIFHVALNYLYFVLIT